MDRATDRANALVFDLGAGYRVFVRLETQDDQALITFDDHNKEASESFTLPKDSLRADLSLLADRARVPAEEHGFLHWEALGVTLKIGIIGRTLVIEIDDRKGDSATLYLPLDYVLDRLQ